MIILQSAASSGQAQVHHRIGFSVGVRRNDSNGSFEKVSRSPQGLRLATDHRSRFDTRPDAAIIVDSVGLPKKGGYSVGFGFQ